MLYIALIVLVASVAAVVGVYLTMRREEAATVEALEELGTQEIRVPSAPRMDVPSKRPAVRSRRSRTLR